MKDGETFASKYESQQLKPNVVMVFSNSPPDVKKLAKVRFRVFNINYNQLEKNMLNSKTLKRKRKMLILIPMLIVNYLMVIIYNTN